jgi:hypothetical protein
LFAASVLRFCYYCTGIDAIPNTLYDWLVLDASDAYEKEDFSHQNI